MSISSSVKAALDKAGKRQNDLAAAYGKSKQSMSMKVTRGNWFGKDLVKIAKFVGADLAFIFPDGSVIKIDQEDPQEGAE